MAQEVCCVKCHVHLWLKHLEGIDCVGPLAADDVGNRLLATTSEIFPLTAHVKAEVPWHRACFNLLRFLKKSGGPVGMFKGEQNEPSRKPFYLLRSFLGTLLNIPFRSVCSANRNETKDFRGSSAVLRTLFPRPCSRTPILRELLSPFWWMGSLEAS